MAPLIKILELITDCAEYSTFPRSYFLGKYGADNGDCSVISNKLYKTAEEPGLGLSCGNGKGIA